MIVPPPATIRRVAFFGTPELAVAPLKAIVFAGLEVPIVVSAPDKRRGRGSDLSPSPVKAWAAEAGLVTSDDPDDVLSHEVDLAVVVAYGRLLRPPLLERVAFVNLHVSLLPRWRGAAPIERAILAGDDRTGVCVMEVTEGLDEGGVYARAETEIGRKTADDLRSELVSAGTALLLDCIVGGFGPAVPQDGEVTYAAKLVVGERLLDWTLPAEQVDRVVRIGGAWTTIAGKRLKVLEAAPVDTELPPGALDVTSATVGCGTRSLALVIVQPEGRAPMKAADWIRGAHGAARLGS